MALQAREHLVVTCGLLLCVARDILGGGVFQDPDPASYGKYWRYDVRHVNTPLFFPIFNINWRIAARPVGSSVGAQNVGFNYI